MTLMNKLPQIPDFAESKLDHSGIEEYDDLSECVVTLPHVQADFAIRQQAGDS